MTTYVSITTEQINYQLKFWVAHASSKTHQHVSRGPLFLPFLVYCFQFLISSANTALNTRGITVNCSSFSQLVEISLSSTAG